MKITKQQLKRIIKEELRKVLKESIFDDMWKELEKLVPAEVLKLIPKDLQKYIPDPEEIKKVFAPVCEPDALTGIRLADLLKKGLDYPPMLKIIAGQMTTHAPAELVKWGIKNKWFKEKTAERAGFEGYLKTLFTELNTTLTPAGIELLQDPTIGPYIKDILKAAIDLACEVPEEGR